MTEENLRNMTAQNASATLPNLPLQDGEKDSKRVQVIGFSQNCKCATPSMPWRSCHGSFDSSNQVKFVVSRRAAKYKVSAILRLLSNGMPKSLSTHVSLQKHAWYLRALSFFDSWGLGGFKDGGGQQENSRDPRVRARPNKLSTRQQGKTLKTPKGSR